MIPVFDHFVGVDWSGAQGRGYSGIAVAECAPGNGVPVLVQPATRRWGRTDFVDWAVGQASDKRRMLIGIDCAFALPAATATGILGEDYSAASLWAHIDAICTGAGDYYGGGFALHEAHRHLFWHSGPRPRDFAEHHRACEHACRMAGLGSPESPLKLVGARQVGKGGLAGMRVLAALRRQLGGLFAVWPFDPIEPARIVCVELYPRLFMRMAGHGNGKVRSGEALNRCLAALGSDLAIATEETLVDHDTDALVAAAGLRLIAGEPAVWSPAGLDSLAIRAEGWIFGVT